MKIVDFTDSRGRMRRALLKEEDPPEWAEQNRGIPQDPPDLDQLNWEEIQVKLHNELMVRGLLNYEDVQKQQNGLEAAIKAALLPRLIRLYRRR